MDPAVRCPPLPPTLLNQVELACVGAAEKVEVTHQVLIDLTSAKWPPYGRLGIGGGGGWGTTKKAAGYSFHCIESQGDLFPPYSTH